MISLRLIFLHARVGLIALCLVLSACLGLVLVSRYVYELRHAELAHAQGEFATVQALLHQGQVDLNLVQTHIERFQHLAQQGLLSTPDRAAWVEQLVQSQRRTGLPNGLSYTLHPAIVQTRPAPSTASKSAGPSPDKSVGEHQFHELEFKLQGVHEEEFLSFLQDFETHSSGPFRVNACELSERTPQGLTVQCSLRFFTLPWAGVDAAAYPPATLTTPKPPDSHPPHLDTLLYSPAEREAMMRERHDDAAHAPSAQVHVSGIVKREHGHSTAWINQHAVAEGQSFAPSQSTRISATAIILNGQRVRVGETLDLSTFERRTRVKPEALTIEERK